MSNLTTPFSLSSQAYRNSFCSEILQIADSQGQAKISGRISSVRLHGSLIFCDIKDESGQAQLVIKKDVVGNEVFDYLSKNISRWDIVTVEGCGIVTRRGQPSLEVRAVNFLSHNQVKNLEPDMDRLDQILSREDLQAFLKARANILNGIRGFLIQHDFEEHTTPILQGKYGGGRSRPFKTQFAAADKEMFLRVTMEMHLKRMVAAGFDAVYEIGKSFRNEGVDSQHMPEFTLLEIYKAYQDTAGMLAMMSEMVDATAKKAGFADLAEKEWKTITYKEALVSLLGLELPDDINDPFSMKAELTKKGYHPGDMPTAGPMHDHILNTLISPLLHGKYIVTGLAASTTPLVKKMSPNSDVLDRGWMFVNGEAVADITNENTDPVVQCAAYFQQAADIAREGRAHDSNIDPRLLHAQLYGLPPTVGVGLGIERLVMGITNAHNIRDVIPFPLVLEKDINVTHDVSQMINQIK